MAFIDGQRVRPVAWVGGINLTPGPLSAGRHTLLLASAGQNEELMFKGLVLEPGVTTLPVTEAPDNTFTQPLKIIVQPPRHRRRSHRAVFRADDQKKPMARRNSRHPFFQPQQLISGRRHRQPGCFDQIRQWESHAPQGQPLVKESVSRSDHLGFGLLHFVRLRTGASYASLCKQNKRLLKHRSTLAKSNQLFFTKRIQLLLSGYIL